VRSPKRDLGAQEALKKLCIACSRCAAAARRGQADRDMVQDEARVGQQGTLSYIWANAAHARPWCVTIGMIPHGCSEPICPERAVGAAETARSGSRSAHRICVASQVFSYDLIAVNRDFELAARSK